MKVILGSSSPRRLDILSIFFNDIAVIKPHIDETLLPGESPVTHVERLALEKCLAIEELLHHDSELTSLLVTSDTIVTIDNDILGKPSSYSEAVNMISRLTGRTHTVISGVTIAYTRNNERIRVTGHEATSVTFKHMNEKQVDHYLSLIHYMDKAGSYAIQDYGYLIVDNISGSYSNVIGFPLRLFWKMASSAGIIENIFNTFK